MSSDSSDFTAAQERLRKWFPDLSDPVVLQLAQYRDAVLKFNKTLNLIPSASESKIDVVHIADCIHACRLIEPALVGNHPVYDFGSGNGFPGLVFAILAPSRQLVLVDKDARKLEFCRNVVGMLNLTNATTLVKGVEEIQENSVFNAVARGFAPLSKALISARKAVAMKGRFFHMKSDAWSGELAQVPSQLFSYWSPSLIGTYRLPETDQELAIVLTEKTGS